jgi:hypothetical protein
VGLKLVEEWSLAVEKKLVWVVLVLLLVTLLVLDQKHQQSKCRSKKEG